MGLGFRLNLNSAFALHSNIPTNSRLFSSSSPYFSGKCCPRLSFLSDPIQACTFSSASPVEELAYTTETGTRAYAISHFSLLMQNLGVLEESFAGSDELGLKREILLHLGRLGALQLFQTCLSRSLRASSFLDLSNAAVEFEVNEPVNKTIVRTGKTEERRKSRKRRLENRGKAPSQTRVPPKRRASKSRSKSGSTAKHEAEMTSGVKMVAELERVREALEKESGGAVSMSCWAEATGVNTKTLRQKLHFGWHCQDEIVRSTKSLILYLARNYWGLGIAVDDLLQAGKLGVLQGAERFDPTKGYRFSTYAHYWIRKAMSRLVARHARGILIPQSLSKTINQIQKTRNGSLRKYPRDDEISKLTGLSVEKIRSASNCFRVVGSVDHKIGDYFSGKHMEFMADVSMKTPEEVVTRQHMRDNICNLLTRLDERERQVLILRYGLTNSVPRSLEEIGKMFKVSKEWIRKIEKNALIKLTDQHTNTHFSHYFHTL